MSSSADTSKTTGAPNLFGEYRPSAGIYDESQTAHGTPRDHWRGFIDSVNRLGQEELALRWENGRRIIREHGITYNVYGDPQGMDRPWELDMVPFLVPSEEWQRVQAGLTQRARLFNLLLADLYGPQRLLRDGVLPPALVFASPAFLRPCHGIRPLKGIYLHLHAADLARSPDGQWWVLADRTQAPSGSGYALENRIVLSRILPDEFRDCRVQRLAAFFRVERDMLRALAPANHDNPNVVLLTPGPYNETYFEHAYLARYLGFTLVEGGDLTVRDCRVFLKTLEGLQPVDVILRRVDDTFCDPLELRSDSFLGVPGLVAAARAGHVCVANALGSGLLESPAFLAFLPSLCRHLMGEELKLPSVATWWCGQPREREYVLEHLDRMVVKPAFGSIVRQPHFGEKLSPPERSKLSAAIRASPQDFVGQEQVNLSSAPVWLNNQLESRRVLMRTFVAATGDGFTVMPGGLTRVSTTAEESVVSMQSGAGSKDTWVQTDGPVMPVTLLTPAGQPVSVAPVAAELPSRVADNLYWLGRYAERLEATLRLLRCAITRMADEASGENTAEWSAMIQILVGLRWLPPSITKKRAVKDLEQEILQLVYNPQRAESVRALVLRIRGITSIARDRFSADTWRILNQLQTDSRTRPGRIPLANALALLNTMIGDLSAFSGMEMENMTRGHGWRFLDFGRRLERGVNLVTTVRAALAPPSKVEAVLEPLLEIADSSITYRRRYFAQAQLGAVLDLLLLDVGNPRSLAFQLRALTEHAAQLPRDAHVPSGEGEATRIVVLTDLLRQTDLVALSRPRGGGSFRPLQQWLKRFEDEFEGLSNTLTGHYFSLTVARVS